MNGSGVGRWVMAALTLAAMLAVAGRGREWSEEVQMTDAEGVYQYAGDAQAKIDSRDVIHIFYQYYRYPDEHVNRRQGVYQQFSQFGRPLTEPMIIGEIADWPDSTIWAYDLDFDRNENVYLLWGHTQDKNITKLSREGEVLEPCIPLDGMGQEYIISSRARLLVRSDNSLVVVNSMKLRPYPGTHAYLAYATFDSTGEAIDSASALSVNGYNLPNRFSVSLSEGDTIHVVGNWSEEQGSRIDYWRIAPDGERLFNHRTIAPLAAARMYSGYFKVDRNGRLVFIMIIGDDQYLVRYANNLELEINVWLGSYYYGSSRPVVLFIDQNNSYHTLFEQGSQNESVKLAYKQISEDGEVLDSSQTVHNFRDGEWDNDFVFSFQDGRVGVIWSDKRFYDHDNHDNSQFFMRYSEPNQVVSLPYPNLNCCSAIEIKSVYPNPFNATSTVLVDLKRPGTYRFEITDITGRVYYTRQIFVGQPNIQAWRINVDQFIGTQLSNGTYFVRIFDDNSFAVKSITMIK